MKATEQYLAVVLFITLYKVILTFESVHKIIKSLNIQLKVNKQYFPVVLLIMLYKVVLTFQSVDKILKCSLPRRRSEGFVTRSYPTNVEWKLLIMLHKVIPVNVCVITENAIQEPA